MRYYRGCHNKNNISASQEIVIVPVIMHINEIITFGQPSNGKGYNLLKNVENRSVETAEIVLTYGGSFALKDYLPTSKL